MVLPRQEITQPWLKAGEKIKEAEQGLPACHCERSEQSSASMASWIAASRRVALSAKGQHHCSQ
jgi:hypothetical protein